MANEMMKFDYAIPAELFMAKRKGGARQPLGYRRFATAAEAIRFAVEDFLDRTLLASPPRTYWQLSSTVSSARNLAMSSMTKASRLAF